MKKIATTYRHIACTFRAPTHRRTILLTATLFTCTALIALVTFAKVGVFSPKKTSPKVTPETSMMSTLTVATASTSSSTTTTVQHTNTCSFFHLTCLLLPPFTCHQKKYLRITFPLSQGLLKMPIHRMTTTTCGAVAPTRRAIPLPIGHCHDRP